MAKATVQAALGPVALRHVSENGTEEEKHYAEVLLMICIFSIILTAPLGAIIISVTGTRLLTKTKQPPNLDGNILLCLNSIINFKLSLEVERFSPAQFINNIPPSNYDAMKFAG